ncbi:MAG: alpha/beta hydrolase [Bacteroidales bacterium]|nr:alpha/beta hydrolase [Bacteroidales bacterium]
MKWKLLISLVLICCACNNVMAQTGTWSGVLDVQGTKLSIVFHLDTEKPSMDSPDQGVKGLPIQIERAAAGKLAVSIPSLAAVYEGQWLINKIVGTFTQMNVTMPLTLFPGEVKPKRPQTPAGPFPYSAEEVSFRNDEVVLNGTLTLPDGCSRQTPAMIMVTGSGIQKRDSEIFDHKPFAVIADALARAGIATLRYDDRGFNGYSGDINNCTTEDFKSDALAAVELLRERFDKVGVIGHSEGGTIAMMIASENKADFIVSLAGMTVSGAETLVWQNRIALKGLGFSDAAIESYCNLIDKAFNVSVNGGVMPDPEDYDLPNSLIQNYRAVLTQIQIPYMKYFLSLDMRPLLGKITCPLLALNGTKDIQVDHRSNLNALLIGLPDNPYNRIEPVEGVNHLFQHCTTGAVTEYRTIENTIAPEVLEYIASWISGLFSR